MPTLRTYNVGARSGKTERRTIRMTRKVAAALDALRDEIGTDYNDVIAGLIAGPANCEICGEPTERGAVLCDAHAARVKN